jgi:hypothetical protein
MEMPANTAKPDDAARDTLKDNKNARRKALRLLLTDTQRAVSIAKSNACNKARRQRETGEERTVRLLFRKESLLNETGDQREARLANQRRISAAALLRETPAQRVIRLGNAWDYNKANADAKHAELAARFQESGTSVASTAFGLGEDSREDEIQEKVHDIMHSSAGVLYPQGDATSNNWVQDHGEHMSINDVLSAGCWAAYFLITIQKITPGNEINCVESTAFLTHTKRDPLWRVESIDDDMNGDLRRFTAREAKSIARSYALVECVSAFDATSIEGGLQRYIEENLNIPHGMCLHKKAGAGSRMQYSNTRVEQARIANGEACIYSVALTMVRTYSATYASVDPSDTERPPPLSSCCVRSHDGETTYNVCVRGNRQSFAATKSVIADKDSNVAASIARVDRKRKRKALEISHTSDMDKSDGPGQDVTSNSDDGPDEQEEVGDVVVVVCGTGVG